MFPGSIRGHSRMAIFYSLTPQSGFCHPKRLSPPLTHTPTSLPEHTKNAILELFWQEVRGLGMQRHRVTQLGRETAVATQPFPPTARPKDSLSISW